MTTNLTSQFEPMLKEIYTTEDIVNVGMKTRPFFAMVPKKTGVVGKKFNYPVKYGFTNLHGPLMSRLTDGTIATGDGSHTVDFNITMTKLYAIANLDRETLVSSESPGAFKRHMEFERDDLVEAASTMLSRGLYRGGSGSLGQIGSISTTTVTFKNAGEAQNFEKDMYICVSSADGTGSLRDSGATVRITGVDEDANTITTATAISSAITGATTSDYIFPLGYHAAAGYGLAAWIPTTAPGATSFFGVDRSVHPTRLGGCRLDVTGTNRSPEDVLLEAATTLGRQGGKPDVMFCSFDQWQKIARNVQGQVMYGTRTAYQIADIGFQTIKVHGPQNMIDIIPDPDCPNNLSYMLTLPTWELLSKRECPHVFDDDGILSRNGTEDSYNIRVGSYFALACRAPGHNMVIKWS